MWLNRSYLAVILPANMIGGRRLQRLSWLLPSAAAGEAPEALIERLRRIVGVMTEHLKGRWCTPPGQALDGRMLTHFWF
jgi:hypothetical protein